MDSHLTIVTAHHSVPEPLGSPDLLRVDSRLRRLSRQTMGVSDLLERRPELRGVVSWSEGVVESVLWSA